MAERDDAQEKTEQATARHLERAREQGQVPRSRELNTAAVLIAGASSLFFFGQSLVNSMMSVARENFALTRAEIYAQSTLSVNLGASLTESLVGLAPFLLLLLIAALLGPVALGGFLFTGKGLSPKFSRLNPLEGLKRMFSLRALVELLKAVAKVVVVGGIAILILLHQRWDLVALGRESLRSATAHSMQILGWSALGMATATLLVVAVDVPFQLFDHARKLRMTRQQVKDELKDTEGKPEVKGRIRQLQREMARSRMMGRVPKADVVITNPTHYSVALRYDLEVSSAPVVVAKGTDLIALKIREIAAANGVPLVRSPALARALFYSSELEQEIPRGLYIAVAQVLAYVFHLRSYRRGHGEKPNLPDELPIPSEYSR